MFRRNGQEFVWKLSQWEEESQSEGREWWCTCLLCLLLFQEVTNNILCSILSSRIGSFPGKKKKKICSKPVRRLGISFLAQGRCDRIHVWLMNSHQLLRWSNSRPWTVSPITRPPCCLTLWESLSLRSLCIQLCSHLCNLIDTNWSWQSCHVLCNLLHLIHDLLSGMHFEQQATALQCQWASKAELCNGTFAVFGLKCAFVTHHYLAWV